MKISIPKPCHENWSEMLPEEQGRFCLKCTKTVVDFSVKSKEEIKDFFREASSQVCGRFLPAQLVQKPKVVYAYPVRRIGQFAWALYLVFGALLFSCADNSATLGEPEIEHVKGDVLQVPDPPKMGKVMVQDSIPEKQSEKKTAKSSKAVKKAKTCAASTQVETVKGNAVIEYPIVGEIMIEEN